MLDLPQRPNDSLGGAEIAQDIRTLDFETREERIYAEVARGNVPVWLRSLERVEMTGEVDGLGYDVAFWVTPDYLAVGSDSDFFLVPLSPRMAGRIADLVGGSLPTPRMVDAVWAAASVRLAPIRIQPDSLITTVRYFERHDQLIRGQRRIRGVRPGVFVAGHKLDVVLRAIQPPDAEEAAFYGWHRQDGEPIQPMFSVPVDRAPHFSVGVRLVHRDVLINGVRWDLSDILRDPDLAPLMIEAMAPQGRSDEEGRVDVTNRFATAYN